MHRLRSGLVQFVLLLLFTGCTAAAVATPRPVLITIAGATSMQPVLQALTEEFTRRHPNVLFTLRGGGSTLGEEQAQVARVQLGASTLFPPDGPEAPGVVRIPIGVDGLAIIVHPSNPIESLTLDQLRDLYVGDILDWAEVGGRAAEIILVSREDGSGARILFERDVMGDEAVSLTAVVMPTSRDVVDYVAKTPNAIGYVSRGWVMARGPIAASRTPGASTPEPPRVRVVALGGTLPTQEALRSRAYPLIQPLYLISRGETRGTVRQFVDFVLSPAGQSIMARYHLPVR